MTEKELDPKKTFRKKLQRLEREKAKEFDLDNYRDVLQEIIHRFEELTDSCEFHWLSGSQLFHYLSAYQELISQIPCIGLTQEEIDSLVGSHFLFWSTLRYTWWAQKYPDEAEQSLGPWWLSTTETHMAFKLFLSSVKQKLGDEGMTLWSLVSHLYQNDALSKDQKTDLLTQLEEWESGKRKFRYGTVKARIIDPIAHIDEEVSNALQRDFTGLMWMSEWFKFVTSNIDSICDHLRIALERYSAEVNIHQTNIPSRYLMLDDVRRHDLRTTVWNFGMYFAPSKFEEYRRTGEFVPSDPIGKLKRAHHDRVEDHLHALAYRHGPQFRGLCKEQFETHLSDGSAL